ncbi:hypothetical protein [Dyadobacter psychrotolerans]|uniref:Outer membrane protein beta-barrel domain-containing protein n=1 Tax=Dyadobacter psychrotolerans TaxID=2541721 RepID=A0A4R5DWX4_9BACT|nr:hypothetical protein [Dyadobacter psychrotolerans]TDE16661.1 hypothetical protein E0F88_10540 [Dyadobacter psychrotolerans]
MRLKLPATLVAFLLITFNSKAQMVNRHEIQIGAGIYANEAVVSDILENFVRSLFGSDPKSIEPKTMANLSYYYRIKPKIALGMGLGYNSAQHRDLHKQSNKPGFQTKTAVMAFEIQFYYQEKDNISIYCEAGFGNFYRQDQMISYPDEIYSDAAITFQATPLGIRVGKKVGAFIEIGYGYKGIVNLGLSGRF